MPRAATVRGGRGAGRRGADHVERGVGRRRPLERDLETRHKLHLPPPRAERRAPRGGVAARATGTGGGTWSPVGDGGGRAAARPNQHKSATARLSIPTRALSPLANPAAGPHRPVVPPRRPGAAACLAPSLRRSAPSPGHKSLRSWEPSTEESPHILLSRFAAPCCSPDSTQAPCGCSHGWDIPPWDARGSETAYGQILALELIQRPL